MPKIEYAIIVRAKTRLEQLTARYNTAAQARFVLERAGGSFDDYQAEHERFEQALSRVQRELSQVVKSKVVDREFLPSFIFADDQVVVVVGQDGLVANAAKYVRGRPLVAVNPDPDRYDGVLLPFRPDTCRAAVQAVAKGSDYPVRTQYLAQATLQDGQRLLAFNDLFIGAASHVSARYRLTFTGRTEEHSSSGIIVATPAGSTGWLSSIFNMTQGGRGFCAGAAAAAARRAGRQRAAVCGARALPQPAHPGRPGGRPPRYRPAPAGRVANAGRRCHFLRWGRS